MAAYPSVAAHIGTALRDCASGRELTKYGCAEDVDIAAEVDASDVVLVLTGESFQPVPARRGRADLPGRRGRRTTAQMAAAPVGRVLDRRRHCAHSTGRYLPDTFSADSSGRVLA